MVKPPEQAHREWYERKLAEIDLLPKIPCKCGCGTLITPIDVNGKNRFFVKGHVTKGQKKPKPSVYPNGMDRPLTAAEKQQRHREKKRAEIAAMPKIPCKCGCGTMIEPINTNFKPAEYAHGHNPHGENTRFQRGQEAWNKGLENTWCQGENSPNWEGGVSKLPYGKGLTNKLKRRIRERDKYTCQRCGIHQSQYKWTIEIHHLNHDKNDHSDENLVCSCKLCNAWASKHRDEPFISQGVWERCHPEDTAE